LLGAAAAEAGFGAAAGRAALAWAWALDAMVLMDLSAAPPAALALVLRSSRRLAAVGPAVVFAALATGTQVWSAGKRCDAQNCWLQL
jgi:hypothetical protein